MNNITLILVTIVASVSSCQTNERTDVIELRNVSVSQTNAIPSNLNSSHSSENDSSNASASFGEFDSLIGNVESSNTVCLKIQNPKLKVGDKIQIILTEKPQEILQAEISSRSSCEDRDFGVLDLPDLTDYQLKSSNDLFINRGRGIGIVNAAQVAKVNNGLASIDLNSDKKDEYFRECTSMEGLHLTAWSGKPLVGKRIWHSYYSLGYDTEPSCQGKDFED